MTVAVDRGRDAELDGRAGARRAEQVALRAADVACDAYRDTLDESLRDGVRPDRVIAVVRGGPGDALASAVADLGSTAFAAARAAHLAAEVGSEADAQRAAEVAECAAAAAQNAALALGHRARDDAGVLLVAVAHHAAMTAHLAADALAAHAPETVSTSLFGAGRPAVAFPPSWRAAIEELARRLDRVSREPDLPAGSGLDHDLLAAADSACAAASHALRSYRQSGHGNGVSQAMARVVRIAALASCYAGCAALDMLEAGAGAR